MIEPTVHHVSQGKPERAHHQRGGDRKGGRILKSMSQAPTSTPAPVFDEDTIRRLLPPYRVVLHNDDHNSMDHVVRSLVHCVPSLTVEEAVEIMFTAHNNGEATVGECPKEAAEHYRSCLESAGLTVTIEPAG
jgi:ATP-dependent Clp protease adaptor protein ClpS